MLFYFSSKSTSHNFLGFFLSEQKLMLMGKACLDSEQGNYYEIWTDQNNFLFFLKHQLFCVAWTTKIENTFHTSDSPPPVWFLWRYILTQNSNNEADSF